jgi:arginyl-tRNA--protein-N-Asp/Glu arginylyltransferase
MARQLQHVVEEPRTCSYLADREAMLEHRILLDVNVAETEALLERGWRRFGPDYFRPACGACSACIPTRIPTATFVASKSQRRAREKNKHLVRRVGVPEFDEERLALYHAWHDTREAARGWSEASLDERTYRVQFAMRHPAARELTFVEPDSGRLVGVGLCDETPNAWSAIYFFYHPDYAKHSLGVANVVFQVELARSRGRSHLYLGYRVEDCPSLAYKGGFRPQERLVGWPSLQEEPLWVPSKD